MIEEFAVDQLYSNDDIYESLKVSNAGGIRFSLAGDAVARAVLMTAMPGLHGREENPYFDRLEDGILTYTAEGKLGEQTLSGSNIRLVEQKHTVFPIHGFALVASRRDKSVGPKRWKYLGILEYLRHYADTQLDADGKIRKVWLFEFRIHPEPSVIPVALDQTIANQVLTASRQAAPEATGDNEIVIVGGSGQAHTQEQIEGVRGKLLNLKPQDFEFFIRDLMTHCGFNDVCVTRYSADGGVDVNARTGPRLWVFERTLVQVQAKRWLHSVGRKEVAELRGSLQPFARGAIVTTSHFSKAAINEAGETGKNPIGLVDGIRLAQVVLDEGFRL